jgi:hypothetical protein
VTSEDHNLIEAHSAFPLLLLTGTKKKTLSSLYIYSSKSESPVGVTEAAASTVKL